VNPFSCTSPPGDLDQVDQLLRSSDHTNACKAAFDSKMLWESYGIIGDVKVGFCSIMVTTW